MADPKPQEKSEWLHPNELMKIYNLKQKKKALQARMNKSNVENKSSVANKDTNISLSTTTSLKRKNPFSKPEPEKKIKESIAENLDTSQDATLLELLNIKSNIPDKRAEKCSISFTDVLTRINTSENVIEVEIPQGSNYVPIDWTLNTKMRIMSLKPFPWTGICKSSEEASGITAFVRCLDIGENESTLDTSPNARFHQCCLTWQHPSLPWLQLFPRSGSTNASQNGITSQAIRDSLYKDWSQSYRSLFHLLRSRQCPYFYLCANSFTVLFRAAGICGLPEIHALITPTTRGFRQAMKQEDIVFTMPLKLKNKRHSGTDSGFESTNSISQDEKTENLSDEENDEDENDEEWLVRLGFDRKQVKHINMKKTIAQESELDNLKQSLVFVTGIEVQGLFNFLLNCKSIIPSSGPLAGIPPTLLSPVAFHNASLKTIKVKNSTVRYNDEKYYSLELTGPLLPHVLPSLCDLMNRSQLDQFTVSCAHVTKTTAFSHAKHGIVEPEIEKEQNLPQSVFGQEGLSDCGFSQNLLTHFCNSNPNRIEVVETIKLSNDLYLWN